MGDDDLAEFIERLVKLDRQCPDASSDDLVWMPEDVECEYCWKIESLTGQYCEFMKSGDGRDDDDDDGQKTSIIQSALPSACPPGYRGAASVFDKGVWEGRPGDVASSSNDGASTNSNGGDASSSGGGSIDTSDEIGKLTRGIDGIKVVYCAPDKGNQSGKPNVLVQPHATRHWAKTINVNVLPEDYDAVVPDPPSFVHPFPLDPFQKQAVYHMERGESVFVAAHTSAGKTAVAEYAIGLCRKHLTKAIYTSPIKALSNQKFRDFRDTFGDEVGLLTGDVQVNPDAASCLIMTTEILRSMLYKDSEVIREVEWVIFDEVHYVNDAERGVVWEEVIIMLPPHVRLILLSATTPNTFEFADWVGRTRSETVYVISTLFRPVPLEHHLYLHRELFRIVDGERRWSEQAHKDALSKYQQSHKKMAPSQVIGGSVFVDMTYFLRKRSLLPAVVFSFSRKKCEEYADCLGGVDLNESATEHSLVHHFMRVAQSKLSPADRDLPQLHRMEEMLKRGIAVHHSGLLPIMKECVEMLFSRGLVKVLFATETFAMGVNMPARTVVFSGLRKHDGTTFRTLLPGEYTQMAGRAGRRGKDAVGTVIILPETATVSEFPSALMLQGLVLGQPTKLASQFRVTYGMILGLLRFETLRVEEMLKRSFSENSSQKQRPEQREQMELVERMIAECPSVECDMCCGGGSDPDGERLREIVKLAAKVRTLSTMLYKKILAENPKRYFDSGRIVVVSARMVGGRPALLMKAESRDDRLTVLTVPGECSAIPYPHTVAVAKPSPMALASLRIETVSVGDILRVTRDKLAMPNGDPSERQLLDVKQRFSEYLSGRHLDASVDEQPVPELKRSLEFEEQRLRRQSLMASPPLASLPECPAFVQHYEAFYNKASLVSRLAEMQFAASDSSLHFLPEYHSRVALLKLLGYVDEVSGGVLLKGRVACELRTIENTFLLVVVEMLFSGYFLGLPFRELAALLSTLYCQEKVDDEYEELMAGLPDSLQDACDHIQDVLEGLVSGQRAAGVQVALDDCPLRFGLVPVVYRWACGLPFAAIALETSALEGTIVRCIARLEEGLRELCHAAKIIGDLELAAKFETASVCIKRDICFASSLYL